MPLTFEAVWIHAFHLFSFTGILWNTSFSFATLLWMIILSGYLLLLSQYPTTHLSLTMFSLLLLTSHNQAHRNRGAGGNCNSPRFSLSPIFDELKEIVLQWKIVQNYKTSWNSSKFIDIYNIIIVLDTKELSSEMIYCQ